VKGEGHRTVFLSNPLQDFLTLLLHICPVCSASKFQYSTAVVLRAQCPVKKKTPLSRSGTEDKQHLLYIYSIQWYLSAAGVTARLGGGHPRGTDRLWQGWD